MADERIVTNIVANADFSNLIADVQKVTASLSKLQEQIANSNKMLANQVAVMNRSFSDTLRSTGQFSTHFVSLQSDVEKFGKNLDSGKMKLSQYFNAYQQHAKTSGGIIRELARQQVQLQNAILQPLGKNAQGLQQFNVHVPRGLNEVANKSKIARQELQILNKVIQDGANQLVNWGKNTQWAGRQLTVGLTVPIAAFGKAAADAFRTADEQLVRLQKVYGGLSATTGTELAKVRKEVSATAKELASGLGASYNETLGLAADIAATGKTGQELIGSIKETTRLAVLGEVDRQDAMKATLALQSAFKQNTDQLSESINFLNAVENQTSTTLGDLIEAIPKAGPVVEGLGGSVKDLALYLTAMKEGGVNASEGANALKSALASLINPTKVATDMFAGFGIDLKGIVTKDAGDLTQTILDLQAALDTLNPLQKQQALEQLFGKFQFARMNALFENLGRQGSQTLQVLDLMKASSQDLAGIAGRELSQVTESASGKYRRALEGLKADLAGVGEQFLSINTKLIELVDKVVNFANNLPKPIKQVLSLIGGLTALAGPFIMLTGVLANFFGYILKGIMHMKAFFKGGEGWKFLTPEMLAAEKAGSQIEKTFYSDAKAASVLELALKNLIDEFTVLEQKAKTGAISVAPALQTMAGNALVPGVGPRVVDPRHPLVGAPYSRASTHMVPRAGMTEEQRMAQTMFGFVPGSIPVNRRIGNNPQIYTNEQLPNVPGLTSIGGTSTGVVAGEAAKWHAMMATLGMQSKAELAALKKEIATTGIVGKDFMQSFEQVLPAISALTDKAAVDSAAIVAELRAGKINVEQARAQIVALNLAVEQDIAATSTAMAQSMGRTLNPTVVPTLNQPVVDATGKSNMRELFKKSKTKQFIDKIAGNLGVRTSGAGYNIETTIPKRLRNGGAVYLATGGDPATHPGRPMGTDTIPAWLSEGEYVVRKEAVTPQTLPILELLNNTKGGEQYRALALLEHAGIPVDRLQNSVYPMTHSSNLQSRGGAGIPSSYYLAEFADPNIYRMTNALLAQQGLDPISASQHSKIISHLRTTVNQTNISETEFGRHLLNAYKAAGVSKDQIGVIRAGNTMRFALPGEGTILDRRNALIKTLESKYAGQGLTFSPVKGKDGEILVSGAGKSFKIRHQATRAINQVTGGGSYELLRQKNPAGTRNGAQLAYSHIALPNDLEPLTAPNPATPSKLQMYARPIHGSGKGFFPLNSMFTRTDGGWKQLSRPRDPMEAFKFGWGTARTFGRSPGAMGRGNLSRHFAGGGMVKSMLLGTGVSMGANMLGGMIGGGLGNAISMGGNILGMTMGFGGMGGENDQQGFLSRQLDKLPTKAKTPIGPFNTLSKTIMGADLTGKRFAGTLRLLSGGFANVLKLTSPLGLALTGVTAAVYLGTKAWKDHNEKVRINALGYGLSSDAAQKAGLKFTDYNQKLKDGIANAKAMQERNKMLYESMTSAGTPMKMTIEQYRKLREQVKGTMGDYIKLFDQTNRKDVGTVASQLKAQFMAAGDSAETATAKIYALIAQSNKSGQAASAISSAAFKGIQTLTDAAVQTTKTFEAAASFPDSIKEQSSAALTSFQAIDTAIADTVSKSEAAAKKNGGTAKTVAQAQTEVLNKINSQYKNQTQLSAGVIRELAKQNPELAKVLNNTDTVTSAWAKAQLIIQGTTRDLSTMSGEAATAALRVANAINAATTGSLHNIPVIQKQYNAYNTLKGKIAELQKASRGQTAQQQIDTRKQTELLNKQIDSIKKTAQAKIDAINKSADAQNTELEIQKEQLAAQQALAQGDMTAYAQHQLSVQQLTNDAQRKSAIDAVNKKADLDIAPLEKKLAAIADANQKIADKASLAGDSLSKLQENATALGTKLTNLETSFQSYFNWLNENPGKAGTTEDKKNQAGPTKALSDLGIKGTAKDFVSGMQTDIAKALKEKGIQTDIAVINAKESKVANKAPSVSVSSGFMNSKEYSLDLYAAASAGLTATDIYGKKTFTASDGKKYTFTGEYTSGGRSAVLKPATRAKGGPVFSGSSYVVGENGPELFSPLKSGTIGPVYNIPGRGPINMSGYNTSGQTTNNMYNVNIEMNGTNVTADDVVRRFKQELALINAKEGRSKLVGGGY